MYKTGKQFIENNIDVKSRIKLFPIIKAGIEAYKDIISSDRKLFDSKYSKDIRGHLKNFVIYRQFDEDMLSKSFPFKCEALEVNNFGYTVPKLEKDKGIILISRQSIEGSLPSKSKYKLKYSENNNFERKQLRFNLDKLPEIAPDEKYLAFLTYGMKDGDLEFLHLMVPDKDMNECIYDLDIQHEYNLYCNNINRKDVEYVESTVATIKTEWLEKRKSK
ncbi:hypothetical protein [Clostridium massiliodielmoense]|uniref:hypothetical protein n=1 Tax=Clostridium massiliodielmoense TaxID=1776385 RepID=UPI000A2712A7|nr:hypothetical protein [Clostridium massiliodielmoense]